MGVRANFLAIFHRFIDLCHDLVYADLAVHLSLILTILGAARWLQQFFRYFFAFSYSLHLYTCVREVQIAWPINHLIDLSQMNILASLAFEIEPRFILASLLE